MYNERRLKEKPIPDILQPNIVHAENELLITVNDGDGRNNNQMTQIVNKTIAEYKHNQLENTADTYEVTNINQSNKKNDQQNQIDDALNDTAQLDVSTQITINKSKTDDIVEHIASGIRNNTLMSTVQIQPEVITENHNHGNSVETERNSNGIRTGSICARNENHDQAGNSLIEDDANTGANGISTINTSNINNGGSNQNDNVQKHLCNDDVKEEVILNKQDFQAIDDLLDDSDEAHGLPETSLNVQDEINHIDDELTMIVRGEFPLPLENTEESSDPFMKRENDLFSGNLPYRENVSKQ